MAVVFKDLSQKFKAQNVLALDKSLTTMAVDIIRLSKNQVPHDTGTLERSGKIVNEGILKRKVMYGEGTPNAPYARRWEFETANFKKGRKSRYLRDPAELISSKAIDYFKRAVGSITL